MVLFREEKAKALVELLNRNNEEGEWVYVIARYDSYRFAIKMYDEDENPLGYL